MAHEHKAGDPDHDHGHHGPASFGTAFAIGSLLNAAFVAAEFFYGLAAHSVALVADSAHNLTDVLGLLLAWGASILARRRPTARRTYGWGRSTIYASLVNAAVLLVSVGGIAVEAVHRLIAPQPVGETTVMVVAAIGIVVNGATALLFMSGRKGDINIKGAFLHMAADAVVSFGVVIAAFLIGVTGWLWLDPVTSLAIVVVISVGTWGLLSDSVVLAMDMIPEGIDRSEVETLLLSLPGVTQVHDLHIWALSTTGVALTAHVECKDANGHGALLRSASHDLQHRFGIGHVTLQIEPDGAGEHCVLAPEEVV